MRVIRSALTAFLAISAVNGCAMAATWHVEKDGSGDFTVIQDAVDAAADGDTLMVGPGRFDDYRQVDLGAWQNRIIHVLLNNRSLTMIGSGVGATVVGPSAEFPITEHDGGIVLVNGAELFLSDLTVERCYGGVECWDSSYLEIARCVFQHHTWGVGTGVFSSRGARISDCSYLNYDTGVFPGSGSRDVVVERCEFRNMIYGLNTTATQNLLVSDCRIEDTFLGIQLWSASTATLVDLDIETDTMSLVVKSGSSAQLSDSRLLGSLDDDLTTVWVDGVSMLSGSGNIIRSDGSPPLRIYRSDVALSNSHILASSGLAVYCEPPFPADWTIDLRNNWWGVSDADSIEALIYDGNDDPDIGVIVQYLPFRDEQVANEAMGWGELKRLYR